MQARASARACSWRAAAGARHRHAESRAAPRTDDGASRRAATTSIRSKLRRRVDQEDDAQVGVRCQLAIVRGPARSCGLDTTWLAIRHAPRAGRRRLRRSLRDATRRSGPRRRRRAAGGTAAATWWSCRAAPGRRPSSSTRRLHPLQVVRPVRRGWNTRQRQRQVAGAARSSRAPPMAERRQRRVRGAESPCRRGRAWDRAGRSTRAMNPSDRADRRVAACMPACSSQPPATSRSTRRSARQALVVGDHHEGRAAGRAPAAASARTRRRRCCGRGCRWARRPARRPGCVTSARAMATRWRSPPDSSAGRWCMRSARPTAASISAAACAALGRRHAPDPQRHGDVVERAELGQQVVELVDEAQVPVAQRALLRRRPARDSSWPMQLARCRLVGASSPPSRCSSVLLPEPEAPTMASVSPACTSQVDAVQHRRRRAGLR